MQVKNTGTFKATGVSAFSRHNFHLGYGRPFVMNDLGDNGETIDYDAGKKDFFEQGFAGVVVSRGLGSVAHHGVSSSGSLPEANRRVQGPGEPRRLRGRGRRRAFRGGAARGWHAARHAPRARSRPRLKRAARHSQFLRGTRCT